LVLTYNLKFNNNNNNMIKHFNYYFTILNILGGNSIMI